MAKAPRNIGASIRARLLNLARERGQVFDLLLTRYALERLLYRLSISDHRDRFVLKGAILVTTWFDDPHRPTRSRPAWVWRSILQRHARDLERHLRYRTR